MAQWVRSLDLTHTSLSPIRRGFAPGFVNYKKGCTRLTAASDKVYQLLAHGRWFSPGTPASSTTKSGHHDIAEIFLKVVLNTKNQKNQSYLLSAPILYHYVINIGAVVVMTIWQLDLQLPMLSVPITTNVVSSNPPHGEVYSIQHYDRSYEKLNHIIGSKEHLVSCHNISWSWSWRSFYFLLVPTWPWKSFPTITNMTLKEL